ncbi:energy transducer TonB [Nitrospirillum amazonense]
MSSLAEPPERVFRPAWSSIISDFPFAHDESFYFGFAAIPQGAALDVPSFRRFPPVYPLEAVRLKNQGRVNFIALCDAKGVVTSAEIPRSSTHPELDDAVLAAAQSGQWRCKPALVNGLPETSWAKASFRFRLSDVGKARAHQAAAVRTPSPQRPPRP